MNKKDVVYIIRSSIFLFVIVFLFMWLISPTIYGEWKSPIYFILELYGSPLSFYGFIFLCLFVGWSWLQFKGIEE